MKSSTQVFKIFIVFCVIASTAFANSSETISNGLLDVRIDPDRGSFSIIDSKRGKPIITDSQTAFTTAPYLELADVAEDAFETQVETTEVKSENCENSVNSKDKLKTSFPNGKSISMISRKQDHGRLQVQFTLYPEKKFVEIAFAFKTLTEKPLRLRKVTVIDSDKFMPGCDKDILKLLNGGSGINRTQVVNYKNLKSENNLLCFCANPNSPRSLTAGGLTYEDFRKYVETRQETLLMYAHDPVGKKVNPDKTYRSEDRFYLDGLTANPFESLETYAKVTQKARGIDLNYYTFPSTCMWFLSVNHFGGDTGSTNNTVGAVQEAQRIAETGFLKYSPVAIRLVPDCYEQNNQQGWWDNKHWQMHGRKERCVAERHYEKPYDTTKKWASKVQQLGSIPLTYFQPGIRSEDYAEAYPGHMLYNESHKHIKKNGKIIADPHWVMGDRGIPDVLNPGKWHPGYGKHYQETYDYTDPDFLAHWAQVNKNLKQGGVQGVFYDYPRRAFPQRGGMENRCATATHAYRNVYKIARRHLGKNAYLQERIGPGSDATLEFVSSVRTAGDNNTINPNRLNQVAVRWYKNRRLTNYDMDGKALLKYGHGKNIHKIDPTLRRAILTLSYTVSGRLLLTESFRLFSDEVLHDLSRLYPFHATTLSARPLDAFINEIPSIFDFPISKDWHQVVLYGGNEEKEFNIPVSGDTAFGALGLSPHSDYYLYDFWNDRFAGKIPGTGSIKQTLPPGHARMLSVHAVENNPQWISTDRHIMQGYVDMPKKPKWNSKQKTLSGTSSVIENEPYKITLALNGCKPGEVKAAGASAEIKVRTENPNLADLVLKAGKNRNVTWKVTFSKTDY